jgi:DNA-binding transcriptional regulator YdaS (Cro superfamily)
VCVLTGDDYERIRKAIKKAGTASNLATLLGIKPMSVSRWKNRYKGVVPHDRVLPIFNITGVTPHELRGPLNPTDGLPQVGGNSYAFHFIATDYRISSRDH